MKTKEELIQDYIKRKKLFPRGTIVRNIVVNHTDFYKRGLVVEVISKDPTCSHSSDYKILYDDNTTAWIDNPCLRKEE